MHQSSSPVSVLSHVRAYYAQHRSILVYRIALVAAASHLPKNAFQNSLEVNFNHLELLYGAFRVASRAYSLLILDSRKTLRAINGHLSIERITGHLSVEMRCSNEDPANRCTTSVHLALSLKLGEPFNVAISISTQDGGDAH